MKIDLLWTAAIAELRSIRSLMKTETAEITEVVKTTVMILASEEWLFKTVTVLGLAGTALAAATIQGWQCLSCCSFSSVSVKAWTCS